jgi:hypothetical protein
MTIRSGQKVFKILTCNNTSVVTSFSLITADYASISDELIDEWVDDGGRYWLCELDEKKDE